MKNLLISLIYFCVLFSFSTGYSQDSLWAGNFGPTGVGGTVKAIINWGDSVVIAGELARLADNANLTTEFAIFDLIDRSWKLIDVGPDGEIRALAINDNGDLIIAGDFSFTYAGIIMDNLTVFGKDGSWNTLTGGESDYINGPINDLLWQNGKLYIGGEFTFAGNYNAEALTVWDAINGFTTPIDILQPFRLSTAVIRSMTFSTSTSKLLSEVILNIMVIMAVLMIWPGLISTALITIQLNILLTVL